MTLKPLLASMFFMVALPFEGDDEALHFIKTQSIPNAAMDPYGVLSEYPRDKINRNEFVCYAILNYKEGYIPAILNAASSIPATGDQDEERGNAIFILRALVGGNEKQLSFAKLRGLIEKIEARPASDLSAMRVSMVAYLVMGESNFPQALDYLKERASFEYWKDHNMPRSINRKNEEHGDYSDAAWSSQGNALLALGAYPKPEAETFLKACLNDPRYSGDEYLTSQIKTALSERANYLERYEISQAAWKKRAELLKANGTVNGIQDTQPAATSPTQPVGTTAPLSSTSNSPKAQSNSASSLSSSTPLFILGILAVVVGLFVFLRRK